MRPGFDPGAGKIPWRRKWPPTPVFLLGGSHGQRSLVGDTVDTIEWLTPGSSGPRVCAYNHYAKYCVPETREVGHDAEGTKRKEATEEAVEGNLQELINVTW